MIRKLNYTGRKKIKRSNIDISIYSEKNKKMFNASFAFSDLDLPANADVYIEPYYKSSFMRFHFGTVGNIQIPQDRYLKDIPSSGNVLFRVKVVDTKNSIGKLLAFADQLKPTSEDDLENKESILWVDYEHNLDQMIWKVSFEQAMPTLEINNKIPNARDLVRLDDQFRGLVLPAAVRQILFKLVENISDLEEEGDLWFHKWAKFIREYLYIDHFPKNEDENEIEGWIDDVVNSLCRKNRLLSNYLNQIN